MIHCGTGFSLVALCCCPPFHSHPFWLSRCAAARHFILTTFGCCIVLLTVWLIKTELSSPVGLVGLWGTVDLLGFVARRGPALMVPIHGQGFVGPARCGASGSLQISVAEACGYLWKVCVMIRLW